ncbi:aspartyl protease family protein [Planctomycetota bacterium]
MRRIILKSLTVLLLLGLFEATACSQEPNSTSDPNILVEFKIDTKRIGFILLPVRFDGEECLFLLDTGASYLFFDISFRPKLGRPRKRINAATLGKDTAIDLYDAPDAFLGPLNLKEAGIVGIVDLEELSKSIGRQIHGIIGISFINHYVVQIDFDNERLSFLRPKKEVKDNWGIEFPITIGHYEHPLIKTNILGKLDVYFAIDTGLNTTGALDNAAMNYVLFLKDAKTAKTEILTASGSMVTREIRLDSFSLGPFEYKNLILTEANLTHLGLGFFSRHIVTFDFPNSRFYLKKGKEFNRTDESGMAGLALKRVAGQTIVKKVYEGLPSQRAGINAGDIIIDIMGKPVESLGMWEIGKLLRSGDKRKIEMTIKRGDETMRVTIVLEKRI